MSGHPKALISWSSGKDSAFSLYEVRHAGEYDVVGALTTVTENFGRVSVHGVREEVLRAQLAAVVFLASDEAGYVTGETMHVNGGMVMV